MWAAGRAPQPGQPAALCREGVRAQQPAKCARNACSATTSSPQAPRPHGLGLRGARARARTAPPHLGRLAGQPQELRREGGGDKARGDAAGLLLAGNKAGIAGAGFADVAPSPALAPGCGSSSEASILGDAAARQGLVGAGAGEPPPREGRQEPSTPSAGPGQGLSAGLAPCTARSFSCGSFLLGSWLCPPHPCSPHCMLVMVLILHGRTNKQLLGGALRRLVLERKGTPPNPRLRGQALPSHSPCTWPPPLSDSQGYHPCDPTRKPRHCAGTREDSGSERGLRGLGVPGGLGEQACVRLLGLLWAQFWGMGHSCVGAHLHLWPGVGGLVLGLVGGVMAAATVQALWNPNIGTHRQGSASRCFAERWGPDVRCAVWVFVWFFFLEGCRPLVWPWRPSVLPCPAPTPVCDSSALRQLRHSSMGPPLTWGPPRHLPPWQPRFCMRTRCVECF